SRALVQRSVYERFTEALAARVARIRIGHPLDPDTELGPLIHPHHADKVLSYATVAREDGATVRFGGTRAEDGQGNYIAPMLFTDASSQMRIAQDEIFGPVLTVIPFADD